MGDGEAIVGGDGDATIVGGDGDSAAVVGGDGGEAIGAAGYWMHAGRPVSSERRPSVAPVPAWMVAVKAPSGVAHVPLDSCAWSATNVVIGDLAAGRAPPARPSTSASERSSAHIVNEATLAPRSSLRETRVSSAMSLVNERLAWA